jgi:hypothetical protein
MGLGEGRHSVLWILWDSWRGSYSECQEEVLLSPAGPGWTLRSMVQGRKSAPGNIMAGVLELDCP